MFARLIAAALPLACVCAASAFAADKADYERCDGFKAPGGSNDGLSRPDMIYPQFGDQQQIGESRIAACAAALADDRLLPAYTLRRVHLLSALALANVQAQHPDAALAALDEAEEVAAPLAADPLYRRSLGLSLQIARAAAWLVKGDVRQVRRLTAEIAAARPYSVSVQGVAAGLNRAADASTGAAADASTYLKLLPLMPAARLTQFDADIDAGQFGDATRLYPLLKTPYPRFEPALPLAETGSRRSELLRNLAADLNAAYAFAALGDAPRSRAIEGDAHAKLAVALAPFPAKKPDTPPAVSPFAAPITAGVTRWAAVIEARRAIVEHHPADALKALIGAELPANAESVELLTALKAALPASQAALAPDPAAMAARVEAIRKAARLNVAALSKATPAPETRLAKYGGSASRFFAGLLALSPDGFQSRTDAAGVTTVEFIGQSTSAPVVEEMTLLRAADLARQQGKAGLLIVDRHDYRRTLTTTYRGVPTSTSPAGYKSDLEVRFVNPAALPPDLAGERDRLLDANAVYTALAPIYITKP